MSDTKRTPGPWRLQTGCAIQAYWLYEGQGKLIGVFNQSGNDSTLGLANARLIAAAPELLAACIELLGLAEREGWIHTAVRDAKAAIAKAEGDEHE